MPVFKPKGQRYYRIQFDIDGKTYVKSSKTTDKRIAERMETKWREEIHSRRYLGAREEITVEQMFDNYLALPLAATTKKGARSLRNVLREYLKRTTTSLKDNASDFDQRELVKFIQNRLAEGTQESTVRTNMLIFSGAWNNTNKKLYNVPELEYTKLKQPKSKTEYLSPEDEDELLTYLFERKPHASGTGEWQYEIHDVVVLLLDTGARYNEIAMLEWTQIDLKSRKIELWRKKNEVESYINMTDRVHQVLQRRASSKMHAKWVFTNWKRNNHRSTSTTYLNEVLKKVGIPYTVHHLRHTFATKLLKAGMTLKAVKELLGHKSITTTMRYDHLEASDVSPKAVAILNEQTALRNRMKIRAVD